MFATMQLYYLSQDYGRIEYEVGSLSHVHALSYN